MRLSTLGFDVLTVVVAIGTAMFAVDIAIDGERMSGSDALLLLALLGALAMIMRNRIRDRVRRRRRMKRN